MIDTISFSQMLSEMESFDYFGGPIPFSIVFVTADVNKNTGGDIHIIGERNAFSETIRRRLKDSIFTESKSIGVVGARNGEPIVNPPGDLSGVRSRNPHHFRNGTVNIMILSSRAIRKVHPRLILYFNDKKVIP